ncbi:MAG: DUF2127 domain-containing protein [Bryobacteraceae bacterium]
MPAHIPATFKRVDDTASTAGLRSIAILEALKGLLALVVVVALLHNLHRDLGDVAASVVQSLHLNPEGHYGRIFIDAADRMDESKVRKVAAIAMGYSTIRLVESYGLWYRRVWAEWFALVSGAAYIPLEVYEVITRRTGLAAGLLVLNVLIVSYMAHARFKARQYRLSNSRSI